MIRNASITLHKRIMSPYLPCIKALRPDSMQLFSPSTIPSPETTLTRDIKYNWIECI